MRIEKCIDDFNNLSRASALDSFIEFEMKLMLDPRIQTPPFIKSKSIDTCKDLFKFLESIVKPINKQTINFIDNHEDNISHIKELVFENGEQQHDKKRFYNKKRLMQPIYICPTNVSGIGMKVLISEEIPSTESNKYDMIRYKNRFEFKLDNWKADFTFVIKSNSMVVENIKTTKDKLFVGINSNNIFDDKASAIWDFADVVEIEFEYTSRLALNIDAISLVTNLLHKFINKKPTTGLVNSPPDILQVLIKLLKIDSYKKQYNTLKKILPNATEINKRQYFELILKNIQDFYITDKIDGLRTILIINQDIVMFNTEYMYIQPNILFGPVGIIVECELIDGKFYAYDIIQYNNKNISNKPFSSRLELLKSLEGIWDRLLIKRFIRLTDNNYKQSIRDLAGIDNKQSTEDLSETSFQSITSQEYTTDGIIFTSANDSYMNTKFYKWKPVESMTIDFLAKQCPPTLLGISPYISKEGYDLYLLFVGIYDKEFYGLGLEKIRDYKYIFPMHEQKYKKTRENIYFPIQFAPSDNPMAYIFMYPKSDESIDGKVVELRHIATGWELLRVREDRVNDVLNKNYYGNNYKVAELIWRNYSNPLTIDLLCSDIDSLENEFYFKVDKSGLHNNIRKYNNMVKRELINHVTSNILDSKNSWTIDIGCGKGQDLRKYMDSPDVRNLIMIDNNENNLCSVIKRKYENINSIISNRNDKTNKTNKIDKTDKTDKSDKTDRNNKTVKSDKTDKTKTHASKHVSTPTSIYIKNLDLKNKWQDNVEALMSMNPAFTINKTKLIICNLAIHYFIYNDNIDNFISFIDALMPSKSRFMFTCLNGKKVFDLLISDNKQLMAWGDGNKYLIKPNFTNKKFIGGEEIEILLPFSNGQLYKESLVNFDLIQKKFKKKKIMLESMGSFDSQEYMDKYLQSNKPMLTKEDLAYSQLLEYAIYYKK
jgi:hypothetical protein